MIKLNNKGQSLVMFVLIIPILLLIMILVIDIGNVIMNKQELDNINYLTMEYGLEHLSESNLENKLINMIILNNNKLTEVSVNIESNKITIETKKQVTGIITKRLEIFTINSNYVGYIKEGKEIIERVWYYD